MVFINGTTNLPVTENLSVWIQNFEGPSVKISPGPVYHVAHVENISVNPGTNVGLGTNVWSANVSDAVKQLVTGDYLVSVYSAGDNTIVASQLFTLLPEKNTTLLNHQTAGFTMPLPSFTPVQTTNETIAIASTTPSSSLPSELPLVVIAAMVIMGSTYRKKR